MSSEHPPRSAPSPAVSVVMPVYRPHPGYLAEAIDSVLGQTFRDLELVIVEDPSDREGGAVVAARNDPRIRYTRNATRTSLPRQHNLAVATARAELVARFDADDVCEPDRIEKQVAFLREHPDIDLVGSQVRLIDTAGNVIGERRYPTDPETIRRALQRVNPLSGSNVMFRRKLVERAGGWAETGARAGLDYEWLCRLATMGFRFANHPDFLIRYRLHGEQIKATKWRASIRTALRAKMRYWWPEMDLTSRVFMLAEVLALALPTVLAMKVFWLFHVRRGGRLFS